MQNEQRMVQSNTCTDCDPFSSKQINRRNGSRFKADWLQPIVSVNLLGTRLWSRYGFTVRRRFCNLCMAHERNPKTPCSSNGFQCSPWLRTHETDRIANIAFFTCFSATYALFVPLIHRSLCLLGFWPCAHPFTSLAFPSFVRIKLNVRMLSATFVTLSPHIVQLDDKHASSHVKIHFPITVHMFVYNVVVWLLFAFHR